MHYPNFTVGGVQSEEESSEEEEVKKPAAKRPAAKKKDTSAFAALAGSDEVISCAHTQASSFTIYSCAPYAV